MATGHSREVRLGIVMYGGVSLAVYENGVAHELYRAVKNKGCYQLIRSLVDSDIIVDIISGTSAGGINGIFLAYALANGKDFSACSDLWRNDGDILTLLRKPSAENANSVLDSEGYYQPKLENAFREIDKNADGEPLDSEIDLFVTGTHYKGRIFTAFDDKGDPIDVKDHRSVFVLSYRQGRKNPFTCDKVSQLAKLARLTSAFPVAFAPVQVAAKPGDNKHPDTDVDLRLWGNLPDEEDAYFLDGGVLDNKPFSYTIDAIFGRVADRQVERFMFYVEPDPERFRSDGNVGPAPNVAQTAMGALVGIPGYESIASDLQSISDHNDRVNRFAEMRGDVYERLLKNTGFPDCLSDPPPDEFESLAKEDAERIRVYERTRLMQLRDSALLGILKKSNRLVWRNTPADRHAAKVLVKSFDALVESFSVQARSRQFLREFDIYYRIRRAFDVIYTVYDLLYPKNGPSKLTPAERDTYEEVLRRYNHQLQIYQIIQFAMESAVGNAKIPIDDLSQSSASELNATEIAAKKWNVVQNILRSVLALPITLPNAATRIWQNVSAEQRAAEESNERTQLLQELRARLDLLTKDGASPDIAPASSNLLLEIEKQERSILRLLGIYDAVRMGYCRFIVADSYIFPLEYLGEINSRDTLKTVRISPIDGHYGYKAGQIDGKICGRALAHFGGFLKSSWRANDILAGRLDAIAQLIECLVTPERIAELARSGSTAASRLADFKTSVASLFRNDGQRKEFQQYLDELESRAAAAQREPLRAGADGFRQFLDCLVKACQREMLEEEVPEVVRAAVSQQQQWNNYARVGSLRIRFLPRSLRWRLGDREVDRAVLNYALEKRLEEPANTKIHSWTDWYNSPGYPVANESIGDGIPRSVLVEITTTAGLVLSNCLREVLGPKWSRRITENNAFRFAVDFPVRTLNKFAHLQRKGGSFVRAAIAFVYALALTLPVFAFYFRNPLLFDKGSVHFANVALLIVAPLALLFTVSWLLGAMRSLAYVLALSAIGIVFVQFTHLRSPAAAGSFIASALEWLWRNRFPIWLGVAVAIVWTLPANQLWDDISSLFGAATQWFRRWRARSDSDDRWSRPSGGGTRLEMKGPFRKDEIPELSAVKSDLPKEVSKT